MTAGSPAPTPQSLEVVLYYKVSQSELEKLAKEEEEKEEEDKKREPEGKVKKECQDKQATEPADLKIKPTEEEEEYEEYKEEEDKQEDDEDEESSDSRPETSEEDNPLRLSESKKVTTAEGCLRWEETTLGSSALVWRGGPGEEARALPRMAPGQEGTERAAGKDSHSVGSGQCRPICRSRAEVARWSLSFHLHLSRSEGSLTGH